MVNGGERYWGGDCGEILDPVSAPFWLCAEA